ncbi:hypothetical protein RND81_01G071500 [Saponaria officinalis]|uniref:Uncharacterized protein n=1 Tax=Saponaria officinalis TaxID=3572 RepID=A0AAW1NDL2_SAPOF
MQDMRDCYDSLLSAAAAAATNSAYEFFESLREMGVCLLQKIALNDDEETGKAMLMILGEVEFELKKQANGMLMMRRRLNNKKKLDGNIFTGTFSDLQSTQLFTLWGVLSIQSRSPIHSIGRNLCSHFRDCRLHCNVLLLLA